jgi:hypothetical protein
MGTSRTRARCDRRRPSGRTTSAGREPACAVCIAPTLAGAQTGPCTDDIAKLRRDLAGQAGLGAPISEPDYGQRRGPNDAAQTGSTAGGPANAKPVGTPETDRAQKGGADRDSGGTPGTVGGVSGPVGAATGTNQADSVASGRIATSPEDVRRQSENRPTAAAAAAKGETGSDHTSEDKVSQAKMALQRAIDLNAKGDQGCTNAVNDTRNLIPHAH